MQSTLAQCISKLCTKLFPHPSLQYLIWPFTKENVTCGQALGFIFLYMKLPVLGLDNLKNWQLCTKWNITSTCHCHNGLGGVYNKSYQKLVLGESKRLPRPNDGCCSCQSTTVTRQSGDSLFACWLHWWGDFAWTAHAHFAATLPSLLLVSRPITLDWSWIHPFRSLLTAKYGKEI